MKVQLSAWPMEVATLTGYRRDAALRSGATKNRVDAVAEIAVAKALNIFWPMCSGEVRNCLPHLPDGRSVRVHAYVVARDSVAIFGSFPKESEPLHIFAYVDFERSTVKLLGWLDRDAISSVGKWTTEQNGKALDYPFWKVKLDDLSSMYSFPAALDSWTVSAI